MNNYALNPPEDCGHSEWAISCPRCFYEMKGLADGTIHAERLAAQIEGAILFNWHVMLVLQDMEVQLLPMTRSIDLSRVGLAKDLIANLKQISVYLVNLVADPRRLAAAMAQASIAQQVDARLRNEGQGKSNSIVLTDTGER